MRHWMIANTMIGLVALAVALTAVAPPGEATQTRTIEQRVRVLEREYDNLWPYAQASRARIATLETAASWECSTVIGGWAYPSIERKPTRALAEEAARNANEGPTEQATAVTCWPEYLDTRYAHVSHSHALYPVRWVCSEGPRTVVGVWARTEAEARQEAAEERHETWRRDLRGHGGHLDCEQG